eukprot:g4223.t1
MEDAAIAPFEDTMHSPLKPVDDAPNAEHTTPPEILNSSKSTKKCRGYARKNRATFSTNSSSLVESNDENNSNVSQFTATSISNNSLKEDEIDEADLNMLLEMDSDDDEKLEKFLQDFENNDIVPPTVNEDKSTINKIGGNSATEAMVKNSSTKLKNLPIDSSTVTTNEKNISTLDNNSNSKVITQKEEEQVEKLFASSSDDEAEDGGNSSTRSSSDKSSSDESSSSSSSEEEDLGNISDAAEDLPASITGSRKKHRLAKKKSKQNNNKMKQKLNNNHMSYDSDDEEDKEIDLRKPNKSLPFNGLINEKKFRDILNFAKTSPGQGLSKRKIEKKEKHNLPITSYLVVGKKKGYLPFCDKNFVLNEELISNVRKELHKLMKLSPKLRSESNLLQPAPLVPLMLNRANRLFEVLWPGVPGVEFKGGVQGVEFSTRMINLAIKTLNPDLSLERSHNSIASSRLALTNALNNAIINNVNAGGITENGNYADDDIEGQSKVLMTSLVKKLRQRKLSRQSLFTNEVLKAKERGAMEVRVKAKRNIEMLELNVLNNIDDVDRISNNDTLAIDEDDKNGMEKNVQSSQGDDDELVNFENSNNNNNGDISKANKERRRSLSAPTTGKNKMIVPTLGSYVSDEDGGNNSDDSGSDSDIELVDVPSKLLKSNIGNVPNQKTNVKKRKASTRIPSFRRFIRSKSSNGTPKNGVDLKTKGVLDGQHVRKNYFKSLRQGKENARLSQHARLQGYMSFDQWKEAERKEAAKKGMDEAQSALTEEIQRKVFGDRNGNDIDLNSSVKKLEVDKSKADEKKRVYTADMYVPSTVFNGVKNGYVFKKDHLGVGYYLDNVTKTSKNTDENSTEEVSSNSAANDTNLMIVDNNDHATDPNANSHTKSKKSNRINKVAASSRNQVETEIMDLESTTKVTSNLTVEDVTVRKGNIMEDGVAATQVVYDTDENEDADDEEDGKPETDDVETEVVNNSNVSKFDRAAGFRESLLREAEMLKKKRGVNAFVEEEASESEDEENMGVGEYGVEDMMKRKEMDLLDEKMDKMSKVDVLKADLDGIVDAPSDDEGDKNADGQGFHAQKMQEEDDMQIAEVVKNIQEGWARKRQGRRRGRDLDLTEGNKRQKGRLGLDHSDDENEEVDEETALAARVERERVRHGDYDYDDITSSDEEEEGDEEIGPNGEIVKKIKVKPESQTHEFEREHESVEVKRLRRLAKEHKMRAIHSQMQKNVDARKGGTFREGKNSNMKHNSGNFVLGRRSSLLVDMDDESSQILGILKRTNTGRRSTSYSSENIMKSGSIISDSTVNDTTSMTANSGTHTARVVQGMLSKSRSNEDSQSLFEINSNRQTNNSIDENNKTMFSRSNPIFNTGRNMEPSSIKMLQQPERPNSRLRRSFSNGSYNQGSFLNANASRQGSSGQSNQGIGSNTSGPTSFGMFNGGNAISRKFVFRRNGSDNSVHDTNSRPGWKDDDSSIQPRTVNGKNMNLMNRNNTNGGFSNFTDSIFMTHTKDNKNASEENLLWDTLASNNFKNKK